MFKGHPAEDGETANQYGWHWEEVIGYFNGVNNIGLFDDPEGSSLENRGMLSVTATPFVFNDELYVMDFDMTIYSEIYAVRGILNHLMKKEGKPSEYLAGMYATMQHPQSIWKMDNETGKFIKCEGFSNVADNPCTEYLWRAAVYDGELYIGTMDSATIYNYVTKLTNLSFTQMTPDEMSDQLRYIMTLVEIFAAKSEEEEVPEEVNAQIEDLAATAEDMVDEIEDMELNPDDAEEYVTDYSGYKERLAAIVAGVKEKIKTAVENSAAAKLIASMNAVKEQITELYNSIDWEGLKMYAYISNAVRDDVWGFEIFKSADGENFEPVTIDGFGDKYNYGARTLLATDNGLYVGTANPFYGAQLFLLKNDEKPVEDPTEEPAPEEQILGDADGDGTVSIFDATAIQRFLADIEQTGFNEAAADVDGDGTVSIFDATAIQRYLVGLSDNPNIGEPMA